MKKSLAAVIILALAVLAGASLPQGWIVRATKVFYVNGRVGIGLRNPACKLDVTSGELATIFGLNTRTTGAPFGVIGQSKARRGTGVWGNASRAAGLNVGVMGTTESLVRGWGVFAEGDLGSSGAKLFHIDHPLDPGRKFLNHYSAEGPEPLLIYRGNVILDNTGMAVVELPDYFEAINRDFQYQLTPIGAPAPHLYIAIEIQDNAFVIAGGEPGIKVSWTVTGVRNDPYMRAYGKPVEEEKPDDLVGKYIHPELYGKPRSSSMRASRFGENNRVDDPEGEIEGEF